MLGTEPANPVPGRQIRDQLDQIAHVALLVDPHMTATYMTDALRHTTEGITHFHAAAACDTRAGDEIMGRDRSVVAHMRGSAEELRRAAAHCVLAAARAEAIATRVETGQP